VFVRDDDDDAEVVFTLTPRERIINISGDRTARAETRRKAENDSAAEKCMQNY
jgi:hypothetical protein